MFSGIIETVGTVASAAHGAGGLRLAVAAAFARPLEAGASVAVNGVCLTVERTEAGAFEATAVPETLARTDLGALAPGDRVNLERPLRVGDELGGHLVQGHVDAVGTIASVDRSAGAVRVTIEVPETVRRFIAEKGSIAVDGASLTVASWREPLLDVALVPYTLARTIADGYRPGRRVHLEADVIARHLERLAAAGSARDRERLGAAGAAR